MREKTKSISRDAALACSFAFLWVAGCGGAGTTIEGTGASSGASGTETCNGFDDDGDGRIDETGCSDPIEQFGGHAYLFVSEAKNWEESRAYCASKGYHLVTIESADENAFLDRTTRSKAVFNVSWWIGLNDRAVSRSFAWEDGTPVGFTNWDTSEPNDFLGEDCVEIRTYTATGRWNDVGCLNGHFFICEAGP